MALSSVLVACTTPQPPRNVVARESDYSNPKARQVLSHIIGPDDMRLRRSGSVVERACHGEASALRDIYRACDNADGEIAEVQIYYLARVFFSLGDSRFAGSLHFASDSTKSFAARHLIPIFDRFRVWYPLTRMRLKQYEQA